MSNTIYIPDYDVPYAKLDDPMDWIPPESFHEELWEGHERFHGIPPTNAFPKGHVPWNKGTVATQPPWTEERKKKHSELMKQRHKKQCHVEGGKKYVKKGPARIDNTSSLNKIVQTCPHCGKEGNLGNMKRWHFDNCKAKDV